MSETTKWSAIFDWDGVIIDSSRLHEDSWNRIAAEEGKPLPEDHFKQGFGMKNEVIIPDVLGWARESEEVQRLARKKEEIYRDLVRSEGMEALPGIETWVRRLDDAGIPMAIASSTSRKNIEVVMERLSVASFFRVIVAGDDVTHGKPDPEVFLKAAEKAGAPPGLCVVFEDAQVGIDAARAAGMKVVAVTTTHPVGHLAGADRIVDRLDELEVEELSKWFCNK